MEYNLKSTFLITISKIDTSPGTIIYQALSLQI